MGGSVGGGKSNSNQQSSFQQQLPGWQNKAFKQLMQQLPGIFNQVQGWQNQLIPSTMGQIGDVVDQVNPAWQQQLQGGAFGGMDTQKTLMDSLQQSLNNPSSMQQINSMIMGGNGNNYADAMKNQYTSDANRAQQTMLGNLDARAAASGMSGGSRHGVAEGMGMRDINQNLQRNLAETGYNTFSQDLDRKLNIAQQADQGTLSRQGMLQNMLGQQNASQQSGLNYGSSLQDLIMGRFQPSMMPWQNASSWSNVIGDPITLTSGQSSGSGKGKNASIGGGVG